MTRSSWIEPKEPAKGTVAPRRPQASDAEPFRTLVRSRGISPANAMVELLTRTECVFRSVVLLDVESAVEFDSKGPDGETIVRRGKIRTRTAIPPRFEYVVDLQAPPAVDAGDGEPAEGSRKAPRLDADFPVQYRTAKEGFRAAYAGNVSTGGMLMKCREVLTEGRMIELYFVLPSEVLYVFPEKATVRTIAGGWRRRRIPSKLRRPFDEIVVQARIVHHRHIGEGTYAYGLSFSGLDRHSRDEIARFCDALQRVKLRKKP
jgi:hypothetical protein